MLESWQNPYAPGTASVPPILTGRDEWLSRFDGYFTGLLAGNPIQHTCFWGPRGMGKTVLLERLGEMGRERRIVARRIEATGDETFAGVFARMLGAMGADLASRGLGLRRVRDAVDEVTVTLGGGPVRAELRSSGSRAAGSAVSELLTSLGVLARERKRAVLLLLDEVQDVQAGDLRAIARGLQACSAGQLPVLMLAGGLPDAPEHIRTAVTYGERYRFAELGPLNAVATRVALDQPAQRLGVRFEAAALDYLVDAAQGYPYLIQLLGHRTWEAAHGTQLITQEHARVGVPVALDELAASVFEGRFARITPTERAYVMAMASLGDGAVHAGEIATALGRSAQSVSRTRHSLIAKGLIAAVGTRELAFTLPHLAAYARKRGESARW
ncbi:MAG: ATP-binding protein [Sporichthyaceae bacterium]